jgi:hypothetical protein
MECEKCKGACQPIVCSKWEWSEWYCEKDHKSHQMSEEDWIRLKRSGH